MSELSKRLLHAAAIGGSNADNDNYFAPVTIKDAKEAADLIDQQAAEIAELTELVEAQKQEILELHDVRDQRDEWRRRAERLLGLATKWTDVTHHDWQKLEGAAQWFEEE